MFDPQRALRRGRRLGEKVLDASAEMSRREAAERARRWRSRAVFIVQCAVAAAASYALAGYVFDVAAPLFAPVAAVICLGMTYGQRFHRALEITVGVAVGAWCGELFVSVFGLGLWQVAAIVAIAMSVASLLGAGTLLVTQAAVQGLVVALLAGNSTAFGRWFEALIGCLTALLMAGVVPSSALWRPRTATSQLLSRMSGLLVATAGGLRAEDRPVVERALARARATEEDLTALRGYSTDAVELTTVLPWYRSRREQTRAMHDLLEPLDRAVRNARVLIRRAAVILQIGEPVPPSYLDHIWGLAEATDAIAHQVATGVPDPAVENLLVDLARRSAQPAPGVELSAEVIRAQIRSILVDYFMMLGYGRARSQQAVLRAVRPEAVQE